ncbi:substrate-binding domain-containing protein [Prevotella stercorea]|uniref:substrate-binding domain-containing protein n=1 Tax=Leyella stercorea TaxID=363265 RepID=UPI001F1FBA31|nr:substrate-binding domain-containing protein [Leyella stercorea]MCF2580168.1 substrate-binding domain-containing protein [Leyella stercorea]
MNLKPRIFHKLMLLLMLPLFLSCGGSAKKQYVIGVSQCSEDVWREKLNEELRIAALYYNNVDLRIKSAYDDVKLQTEQINSFVDEGVDLLIVAPGQVTISPAIDRAYEKGIPVIIFDRRTRSDKYTAYIGADNKEIGSSMAEYLAGALTSGGRILELCGLSTSSPAIERQQGFDSVVATRPGLEIVAQAHADWTEQGAFRVMDSLLSKSHPQFDCLFAHNDRMAMGARRAAAKHGLDINSIQFCGIDAMPQNGGGMRLVTDGTLFASYIYPTRGDEVIQLAMNILTKKDYKRENQLSSALVTRDNARVLLMQNDETVRQQDHLTTLRSRIDQAASEFNTQRIYLLVLLVFVVLLIVACAFAIRAYVAKARINRQLHDSMSKQKAMTEEMERMTQTQLQFFTNVSHELRTPLTLIAGPADQLLEDGSIRGNHRSMLQMIQRNTRILIQLVGEILDFRKVQNNKATLRLNRFALSDELSTWAEDFRAAAARRKITIVVAASGSTDTSTANTDGSMIIADRDKIEHVYFNLMSNALKYTPEGGSITTTVEHAAQHFTITVSDTGKGIDPKELPHLFERFYQAQGSIGGTGIGLSLVKAYVDMHHGTIEAQSEPGKGTSFVVTLPDTQPGYDPANDQKAAPRVEDKNLIDDNYVSVDIDANAAADRITNAEDFDSERPLVLIIDDNNGMRVYLRSILKDKYNVSEAADGKQGLEKACREIPKLVICDVMMPVMDGLEFTRQLKQNMATSHIPVILLTARSLSEQREEGYGTGADSYLTKPFSGSVLLARVDNLLRNRTMLRSLFSGDKKEEAAEEQLGSRDQTFINRLRDSIRQNMGDSDFTVERLGEEVGLSRVQLYRKVKALTGQTPVDLLKKARLERARLLVEKTDKSISEIAYEVGFTAPSYFNKCFKDEFGVSPGGLRERGSQL